MNNQSTPSESSLIKGRSWASYVNLVTASIDETRRVMKAGGLREPGVAEHLQSSRISVSSSSDR